MLIWTSLVYVKTMFFSWGYHHDCYISLYVCLRKERKFNMFGITWGWVKDDRTFICGWTILSNVLYSLLFYCPILFIIVKYVAYTVQPIWCCLQMFAEQFSLLTLTYRDTTSLGHPSRHSRSISLQCKIWAVI